MTSWKNTPRRSPAKREPQDVLLFVIQSLVALLLPLFTTQERVHKWASNITIGGLVLWIGIIFILAVRFREYILWRAPWSFAAIIVPSALWISVAYAKGIDLYYAGIFTPPWIAAGLLILVMNESKPYKNDCGHEETGRGSDIPLRTAVFEPMPSPTASNSRTNTEPNSQVSKTSGGTSTGDKEGGNIDETRVHSKATMPGS